MMVCSGASGGDGARKRSVANTSKGAIRKAWGEVFTRNCC